MSPAFTKGIAENLPNAAITFDKFHAVKIINDAVERYAALNKRSKVCCVARVTLATQSADTVRSQRKMLAGLPTRHLKIARAYQIRLAFQNFYREPSEQAGASYLEKWYFGPPIAGSNQLSPPRAPSNATGTVYYNGLTARSLMA